MSVFPCLSHLSWPRRATGPSKSPMVSWGCDSSASPNLRFQTWNWCTFTFHLTFTNWPKNTLYISSFQIFPQFHRMTTMTHPETQWLTWNRPMSPTPTSTGAGNEAIGPSIRAPGVCKKSKNIFVFVTLLEKKSWSHKKMNSDYFEDFISSFFHLKRFKRACVAETPGATSLHRVGSFTCFFAR